MKYTRYGQCIATDTCEFEVSTPLGFKYLVTFLDLATKYLFIYFTRTHTHSEMRNVIVQFMADAKPYLSKGHVELWFMDNGSASAGAHVRGNSTEGLSPSAYTCYVLSYGQCSMNHDTLIRLGKA